MCMRMYVLGLCLQLKVYLYPFQPGSCRGSRNSSLFELIVRVCVCLYMCVWKFVIKVTCINNKQTHHDVTCNTKVEM